MNPGKFRALLTWAQTTWGLTGSLAEWAGVLDLEAMKSRYMGLKNFLKFLDGFDFCWRQQQEQFPFAEHSYNFSF